MTTINHFDERHCRPEPISRPEPCRKCQGQVASRWTFDYVWPDGITRRSRIWRCQQCGGFYLAEAKAVKP